MKRTPLTERIERYLAWSGSSGRVPLHPDEFYSLMLQPQALAAVRKEFPSINLVPLGH